MKKIWLVLCFLSIIGTAFAKSDNIAKIEVDTDAENSVEKKPAGRNIKPCYLWK